MPTNFSTGEGGTFWAPTFNASDFGDSRAVIGGSNDAGWDYQDRWGLIGGRDQGSYGDIGKHLRLYTEGGNSPNYVIENVAQDKNAFDLLVKSGEKQGTTMRYNLVNGQYVPQDISGTRYWDTNPGRQNLDLLKVATAAVGGAFMGPALTGAGNAIAAGSMPTLGQMGTVASLANTASGGQIPGLNLVGALGSGYGALGNLASGSGGFMDALKLASSANKLYNGYNSLTQDPRNPSGGGMVGGANSQMPGGAGGGMGMTAGQGDYGWLNQLFNMGGALYSANKNDNYADEMRRERERSLAERQPFLDRMNELSGDAGAERFRTGGQYQAAERVAANAFTRRDASRGNLANDTDRTRLLQDHFMKNLDQARGTARADMTAFDEKASRDALMKAIEMDRMKNSPLFAGAAYGAGGGQGSLGGAGGLINMIPGAMSQIGNWYDQLRAGMPTSTWGSQAGAPGADPNYGQGSVFESDYPYQDIYADMQPGGAWWDDGSWGE